MRSLLIKIKRVLLGTIIVCTIPFQNWSALQTAHASPVGDTNKAAAHSIIMVANTNDSGIGSLRQVVETASSGDTIKFTPSLAGQTITLASEITIQKSITIDGIGLNPPVEISGGNEVRIFLVDASSTISPTIKNIVLKEGKQTGLSYKYYGGAIFIGNSQTLTIENTFITNNTAYVAGAIYISSRAVATISNSEIIGNEAETQAGAIRVQSTGVLNLRNSVISDNVSGSSGTIYFNGATSYSVIENNLFENNSASSGGAISGELPNSRMEIRNNLFAGNHATSARGGAVYFSAHTVPTLVILENNTFYNNDAAWEGGGAYLDMGPTYYLINNTFSNNMATTGGNLYLNHGASVSRMYNNIIANHAGGGDCIAFYNSYINGSNNLIEDGGSECFPTITGDPGLLPLADNGGPTMTMALPPSSPAIDAGDDDNCTVQDQRGALRPQGDHCDLGAVEVDDVAPSVVLSNPDSNDVRIANIPFSLIVTFSEPMDQYHEGAASNSGNYLLINDNGDGFQTTSCAGGISSNDLEISVDQTTYDSATLSTALKVNNEVLLADGVYRLFICGTGPSVTDVAGNPLNEGSVDTVIEFQVISISSTSVPENEPVGTNVAVLTPPDGSNFIYDLAGEIADCNGVDNASFDFNANQLNTAETFNYESKNNYTICIRVKESKGDLHYNQVTIAVTDVNEPPTDLFLSNTTVGENKSIGSIVGLLNTNDPDAGSVFTYSLAKDIGGCNGADNDFFTLSGNILRTAVVFDYETRTNYNICVQSMDNGNLDIVKEFNIAILNTNDAPSDIVLTNSTIAENQPGNTTVGYLIAIDPDGPTTTEYTLLPSKTGCSSTGFNWFQIVNINEIRTIAPLDFEASTNYSLCVDATDGLGASFEKELNISVSNINEAPTNIELSSSNIFENQPIGTLVGLLTTTDPEPGSVFAYNLVSTGLCEGPDINSFVIENNTLNSNKVFDYETKNQYLICIRTVDAGDLAFDKQFLISVTNDNELPSISLKNTVTSISENTDTSSAIKVADITIADDGTGTNILTVSGADAALFKISGVQLFIKAGVILDFETNPILNVNVSVDDPSIGTTPDDAVSFNITVTDVDDTYPTVLSVNRAEPSPTSAASVDFAVIFSEAVTGVDTSDFSLTSTVTGVSIMAVSGYGDTYTVTVVTGSGDGTIRLDVKASGTSIQDLVGNPLSGGYTDGESYSIQKGSMVLSPTSLDFGDQLNWVKSKPQTVTITNYSGTDVHIGTLRRSSGKYLLGNNTCNGATLVRSR